MPEEERRSSSPMTIGRLAKQAGVNVETVRYYERRELIDQPKERRGAFRVYPAEAVRRLRTIKRAQQLGFSLEEIRELLELKLSNTAHCRDVQLQAERKVAEIEEKIRELSKVKRELESLVSACRAEASVAECPILVALDPLS